MYGACDLEKNIKILWIFFEINVLNIHTRIKQKPSLDVG